MHLGDLIEQWVKTLPDDYVYLDESEYRKSRVGGWLGFIRHRGFTGAAWVRVEPTRLCLLFNMGDEFYLDPGKPTALAELRSYLIRLEELKKGDNADMRAWRR